MKPKSYLSYALSSISTLSLSVALMDVVLPRSAWAMEEEHSQPFEVPKEYAHVIIKQEKTEEQELTIELMAPVKKEPSLESSPKKRRKVRMIKEINRKLSIINRNIKHKEEQALETCLPCNMSLHNYLISGAENPEPVCPTSKPRFEHMEPVDGNRSRVIDPLLEKLSIAHPTILLEEDENGTIKPLYCLSSELPPTFLPLRLSALKDKVESEGDNVHYKPLLLSQAPIEGDLKPDEVAIFTENNKIYYQFHSGQKNKERFEIQWELFPEHEEFFAKILHALKGEIERETLTHDEITQLLDHTLWYSNARNIPSHQYEEGGETFKTGILYLPYRENSAKAHFLTFYYSKEEALKKKRKKDNTFRMTNKNKKGKKKKENEGKYELYIIDPQSGESSTFEDFLEDYKDAYAENIKVWYGQHKLNYDCNKSVKDMFADLKKEEEKSPQVPTQESVITNRKTNLKITLKRSSSSSREEETTPLKLPKLPNLFQSERESQLTNLTSLSLPELPPTHLFESEGQLTNLTELTLKRDTPDPASASVKENPWAKFGEWMKSSRNNDPITEEIHEKAQTVTPQSSRTLPATTMRLFEKSSDSSSIEEDEAVFPIETEGNSIPPFTGRVDASPQVEKDSVALAQYDRGLMYLTGEGVPKDLQRAYRYYKSAADQGNATAQCNLGHMYYKGDGAPKDLQRAYAYYKSAADQGNVLAQYNLGVMYHNGEGVPKDLQKAYQYFKSAADQGNVGAKRKLRDFSFDFPLNHSVNSQPVAAPQQGEEKSEDLQQLPFHTQPKLNESSSPQAQYNLGLMYYKGEGVPKNLQTAYQYFKSAADQGDPNAQCNLGVMYYKGDGVPKDLQRAYAYYKSAADQGNVGAQYNLGLMCYKGEGVPKDLQTAYQYFKSAAEQGDAMAQYNLGVMYYQGDGVPKDLQTACHFFKLFADQGNANAQYMMGLRYHVGEGVPKDLQTAYRYIKSAADQGNPNAQCNLGVMYYKGDGAPKDLQRAYRYYKSAADQGNATAQCNLGHMYYKGEGVPQDSQIACHYFKLSADQGHANAQYMMGLRYHVGEGVPKDLQTAYRYIKSAADQGNPNAQCNLGVMYYKGDGAPKDLQRAYRYYKSAADQGNATAQCNLGHMYYKGEGVPQDSQIACHYFKLSADQGNVSAKRKLNLMDSSFDFSLKHSVNSQPVAAPQQGEEKAKNLQQLPLRTQPTLNELSSPQAQYMTGLRYHKGEGVPKDLQKAYQYFKLSADEGNANAQSMLGVMYFKGEGVPKDLQRAYQYFKSAANKRNAIALSMLGFMYFNGEGVPKNLQRAYAYYKSAADQGAIQAKEKLADMQRLEQPGVTHLQQKALISLGDVCYKGENYERALNFYSQALQELESYKRD